MKSNRQSSKQNNRNNNRKQDKPRPPKKRVYDEKITALYADEDGEIYDAPGIEALARVGDEIVTLTPDDLIPLPENADLMLLPGRSAIGRSHDGIETIAGTAVAAMLPAGYTRTHLPAFHKQDDAPMLPLYGYTAVVL